MELITCKGLVRRYTSVCLLLLLLGNNMAFATIYTVSGGPPGTISPAGPNGETSPPVPNSTLGTQFSNNDTVHLISGAVMATQTGSLPYTIGVTDTSVVNGISLNLTVDQGATLSYAGSNSSAGAYYSSRADNQASTTTINISGNVSAGSGLYALYLSNTNAAPQGTYNINLNNTANITGAIVSTGIFAPNLNISGNPTINGVISLGTSSVGLSTLTVGQPSTANFTPGQTISNIGLLHITNNSSMTINVQTNNINNVTVDSGSTLTLNSTLVGIGVVDGNITNNGTINLGGVISKTGTFSGSGTNVAVQGASAGININTSTYQVTNHIASMVDIHTYGNINLTTANFKLNNGGANLFTVAYGGVNGTNPGFFTTGTYTLVTATGGITAPTFGALPTNTLFLAFSNLVVNGNKIQINITRTPFQTYAQTNLTRSIAQNLEVIGAQGPSTNALQLLDAVEASTTSNQLEYALRSLAPLADAPFYGYVIQNEAMNQVKLRLAEIRNRYAYFAGDIGKDNHVWVRPFGSYGNQKPKQDSLGYYATCGGVAGGFDRNLDDRYTVGGAFAYALSHVNDKINPQSVTNLKSYIMMVYGTYNFTATSYLDWVLAVEANNFAASRLVNVNGLYTATATSSYGSQEVAVLGLWNEDYEAFGFLQLTPQAQAQLSFSKQYTYTESGAQAANLTISRTNSAVVSLALGGKAALPLLADPGIIMPEIHGMLYYNPVVGKQNTIFNFVAGGGAITSIMDLSRTALTAGAALTIAVVDSLELKLDFDYQIANKFNGWYTYLNLRYFL